MALVDDILATIRQTESGGNYRARNPKSSASGAYQFINSTWRGLGGSTRTAAEASPEEQDRIARAYVERILAENNNDPRAVFKAWYVGNPRAAEDFVPAPEAGNRLTVGQYADLQMRRLEQNGGQVAAGEYSGNSDPATVAAELYGGLAAYLNEPEVGDILRRAARERWSPAQVEGALQQTEWWRATNDAAKQWGILTTQNPTEAESRIGERIAVLEDQAQQMGFTLSAEGLRWVAEQSLKYGWNQAQIKNALGAEMLKRPGDLEQLRKSNLAAGLRQVKMDYAVPISDQAMDQWVQDVATGKRTADDFRQYVAGVAKSLYPTISAAIDSGATVAQIFDPYRQIAAQTLGVLPDSIDLSDPKWIGALSAVDDKGNRAPLRLDQWQTVLRSDPKYGYQYTKNANDEAERLGAIIGKAFGKVA